MAEKTETVTPPSCPRCDDGLLDKLSDGSFACDDCGYIRQPEKK